MLPKLLLFLLFETDSFCLNRDTQTTRGSDLCESAFCQKRNHVCELWPKYTDWLIKPPQQQLRPLIYLLRNNPKTCFIIQILLTCKSKSAVKFILHNIYIYTLFVCLNKAQEEIEEAVKDDRKWPACVMSFLSKWISVTRWEMILKTKNIQVQAGQDALFDNSSKRCDCFIVHTCQFRVTSPRQVKHVGRWRWFDMPSQPNGRRWGPAGARRMNCGRCSAPDVVACRAPVSGLSVPVLRSRNRFAGWFLNRLQRLTRQTGGSASRSGEGSSASQHVFTCVFMSLAVFLCVAAWAAYGWANAGQSALQGARAHASTSTSLTVLKYRCNRPYHKWTYWNYAL